MPDHVTVKNPPKLPPTHFREQKPCNSLQSPTLSVPYCYLAVSSTTLLFAHFPPITMASFLFLRYTLASRLSHLLFSLTEHLPQLLHRALSLTFFRWALCSNVIRKDFYGHPPQYSLSLWPCLFFSIALSAIWHTIFFLVCLLLVSFIRIKTPQEQESFWFTAVSQGQEQSLEHKTPSINICWMNVV